MAEHLDDGALLALALGDADPAASRHLAACLTCRRAHRALLDGVDLAVVAAPGVAPPPGFESRVLDRLREERPPAVAPSRRSRWLVAAAAAVLGVAAGVGGAQLLDDREPATVPAVTASAVPLETDGGTVVGSVAAAHGQDGEQLVVAVGPDAPPGWLTCRAVLADGSAEDLARWPVDGYGEPVWTVDRPAGAVAVELVTDSGAVWARAGL